MKLDSDDVEITTSKLLSNGEEINHNLKAAFKLWEMLNSIDALKHGTYIPHYVMAELSP